MNRQVRCARAGGGIQRLGATGKLTHLGRMATLHLQVKKMKKSTTCTCRKNEKLTDFCCATRIFCAFRGLDSVTSRLARRENSRRAMLRAQGIICCLEAPKKPGIPSDERGTVFSRSAWIFVKVSDRATCLVANESPGHGGKDTLRGEGSCFPRSQKRDLGHTPVVVSLHP
jgi:hypothetical protein